LDRAGRGRPGDQHACRYRRAHGRLGDPRGGDSAADPLHHDDVRRDGGGAGDRGGAAWRARGDLAPGDPRTLMGSRTLAPFGRRATPVTARDEYGPYVVLCCEDREGPRPDGGQFYMLSAAERWGGGDGERPFLPRAFSVLRAPAGSDELQFLIEDVGPGTNRLCELDT